MVVAKAMEDTVSTYLRIPKSAADALHDTASLLNLPLSRVVNALFHFTLAPASFQSDWQNHVKVLRAAIDQRDNNAVRLCDFTVREWSLDKHRTYTWLELSGLVEDLAWRQVTGQRVVCSFKVSDTGRVVAEVFKNAGMTEDDADDVAPIDEAVTT